MKVLAITDCFRNLKQRRLSRKLQTKQLKNQVELPISPVISQLANMTFFNSRKVRTENVYDNTMLKFLYIYNNRDTERIALLYKKNPNTEITWEMIHKYLSMDKDVTEAFFK